MPLSEFQSWSWPDRAAALALQLYEYDTCSGCGGQRLDTTNPDKSWAVSGAIRCHKCTALHEESEKWAKVRVPEALSFSIVEKERKPR